MPTDAPVRDTKKKRLFVADQTEHRLLHTDNTCSSPVVGKILNETDINHLSNERETKERGEGATTFLIDREG